MPAVIVFGLRGRELRQRAGAIARGGCAAHWHRRSFLWGQMGDVRFVPVRVFRVRHIETGDVSPIARVQIAPNEMSRVSEVQVVMETGLLAVGYGAVEIDPSGYRTGL